MAKNGGSDRSEPVNRLWEKYEKGEIGAGEIIKRLRGHATYLGCIRGDIDFAALGNIKSTVTAARYLMRMMKHTGKYNSLDEAERNEYDDVAMQLLLEYEAIIGSEEYKAVTANFSKSMDGFIGDIPPGPEAEPSLPRQAESVPGAEPAPEYVQPQPQEPAEMPRKRISSIDVTKPVEERGQPKAKCDSKPAPEKKSGWFGRLRGNLRDYLNRELD